MASGWCGGISTMGLVHMWPCREIVMGTSGNDSDFLGKTLYSEIKTMSRNTKSVSMEQSEVFNQIQRTSLNLLLRFLDLSCFGLAWL